MRRSIAARVHVAAESIHKFWRRNEAYVDVSDPRFAADSEKDRSSGETSPSLGQGHELMLPAFLGYLAADDPAVGFPGSQLLNSLLACSSSYPVGLVRCETCRRYGIVPSSDHDKWRQVSHRIACQLIRLHGHFLRLRQINHSSDPMHLQKYSNTSFQLYRKVIHTK